MVYRLPVQAATFQRLITQVDFHAPPHASGAILPGSTWNFQAWFLDPCAAGGFQLSDALAISFF